MISFVVWQKCPGEGWGMSLVRRFWQVQGLGRGSRCLSPRLVGRCSEGNKDIVIGVHSKGVDGEVERQVSGSEMGTGRSTD
jgi:hypothetical protein